MEKKGLKIALNVAFGLAYGYFAYIFISTLVNSFSLLPTQHVVVGIIALVTAFAGLIIASIGEKNFKNFEVVADYCFFIPSILLVVYELTASGTTIASHSYVGALKFEIAMFALLIVGAAVSLAGFIYKQVKGRSLITKILLAVGMLMIAVVYLVCFVLFALAGSIFDLLYTLFLSILFILYPLVETLTNGSIYASFSFSGGGFSKSNLKTKIESTSQARDVNKETFNNTVEALKELNKLKMDGLISDEEYQKKKAEILQKM